MKMTRFWLNKGALNCMCLGSGFREGKDLYENDQILVE
jgi:hypothetical protein